MVPRNWVRTAVAAAVFMMAVSAVARAEAPEKVTSVEGITEYRLDNGLKVLLFPEPSRPKVTVNLTVLVGSRHEGYGETGMAHLLEHMVFKGTPDHPDIPGALKRRGASFNGTTWLDRTNYFETLPASDENLEFAIALEADRMANSPIKAEDLASEFSVVRNEFEMGENSPSNILNQRMMAVAYEWHNYGKSTIGNKTDIERVPAESLRAFYHKFYRPENAVLVIAGQFDQRKALEYVEKYFGPIENPEAPLPKTYTEEPPQDGERVVTLRRVGDVAVVGAMYHVPAGPHPQSPAIDVLAEVLGSEPSGRLYKALVETKKAASVSVGAGSYHDPGVIEMYAEVADDGSVDDVRDTMLEVVEKGIQKNPPTEEEVDRAKTRMLKQRELAEADPNRMAISLSEWAAQGDWRLYFLYRDRLEKVTPEDVAKAAETYLVRSNRTVGIYLPTDESERAPVPSTPNVLEMVKDYKGREAKSAGEAFDVAPMAIQARVKTPDPIEGVKVAFLPKKTRGQSVILSLTLRYGNDENLKGLTDAADFLPSLMMRGTKSLSRQDIQDKLDAAQARLNLGGGTGTLSARLETKREHLTEAIDILRQILREPTLPEDEFAVLKTEQLAQAEQGKSEPTTLASVQISRMLHHYSKDDVRYVPTVEEQIGRIKELSLDQVKTLYDGYLGSEHGELSVVGDFDPSEVRPALEKALEDWEADKPYGRIERPYQKVKSAQEKIETPDKANAIYLGGITLPMKDDDPDYPALVVAADVLGGSGLSSRLGDRLRQKGGLSYGAGANFSADAQDERAGLTLYAIFNPENTSKVNTGIHEELEKIIKDGITEDELKKAVSGYLQEHQVRRSNDGALASILSSNLHLGRSMEFQADLEEKVQALSVEDVNNVLKKHIDPETLSQVIAGDLEKAGQEEKAGE